VGICWRGKRGFGRVIRGKWGRGGGGLRQKHADRRGNGPGQPAGDSPRATGDSLCHRRDSPRATGGQHPTIGGQPLPPEEQPPTIGGQPLPPEEQPSATGGQPPTIGGQPLPPEGQPSAIGGQPPCHRGQPLPPEGQPSATGGQPPTIGGQHLPPRSNPPPPRNMLPPQKKAPCARYRPAPPGNRETLLSIQSNPKTAPREACPAPQLTALRAGRLRRLTGIPWVKFSPVRGKSPPRSGPLASAAPSAGARPPQRSPLPYGE
jgi:hypothetical protein